MVDCELLRLSGSSLADETPTALSGVDCPVLLWSDVVGAPQPGFPSDVSTGRPYSPMVRSAPRSCVRSGALRASGAILASALRRGH